MEQPYNLDCAETTEHGANKYLNLNSGLRKERRKYTLFKISQSCWAGKLSLSHVLQQLDL